MFGPFEFVFRHITSRNGRLLIAVLAGVSLSALGAGYLLQRRRRRYRAVSTSRYLQRTDTFQAHSRESSFPQDHLTPNHTPNHTHFQSNATPHQSDYPMGVMERKEPVPDHTHLDTQDGSVDVGEEVEVRSESSDDSFHSTVEEAFDGGMLSSSPGDNQLYMSAQELVHKGGIQCRTMRAETLCCRDDADFLAKLHCVRLAFDALMQSSANRDYFLQVGRDLMAGFLRDTNQSADEFVTRFDGLTQYLQGQENWEVCRKELTARNVVCMNIYDIALDFILLDAFEDLDNPPAAVVAVLQNRWITAGMKTSALSAAIWSISKAKKSMLKHKNGFMAQFYSLSETISPTLAWGFLGTDPSLRVKCQAFRGAVLGFVRAIFNMEEVRYSSVESLADDILTLAQKTAHSMDTA